MTIGEIQLTLDAFKQMSENKAREKVATNYNLATFISSFVVRQMNGESIPTINELYPDMFSDEIIKEDLEKIEKQKTEYLKAQLMEFTIGHNRSSKT